MGRYAQSALAQRPLRFFSASPSTRRAWRVVGGRGARSRSRLMEWHGTFHFITIYALLMS